MDPPDTKSTEAARDLGQAMRDEWPAERAESGDVRAPSERPASAISRGQGEERSVADLLKELRDETITLMRQELALAKTEMSEKAAKAARNATYATAGAVMIYLGALFGLVAASVGLALLLGGWGLGWHAWWLAPLIVAALVGVIGCVVTAKGVATLKRQSLVPEKTLRSLQEDKQWLQEKVTTSHAK